MLICAISIGQKYSRPTGSNCIFRPQTLSCFQRVLASGGDSDQEGWKTCVTGRPTQFCSFAHLSRFGPIARGH
jgi:hypothetical protein